LKHGSFLFVVGGTPTTAWGRQQQLGEKKIIGYAAFGKVMINN